MKMHNIRTPALGSAIGLGLAMLQILNASPSLAAQPRSPHHAHHLSIEPRSSGYGFVPGPTYSPGPPYSLGTWDGVEFYSKPGSSSLDPCGDMCGAIN